MTTEHVVTVEERWGAWQGRGRAGDVRVERRMHVVTLVTAIGVLAPLIWIIVHRWP